MTSYLMSKTAAFSVAIPLNSLLFSATRALNPVLLTKNTTTQSEASGLTSDFSN